MRIEKISEKQIRCILSNDDLNIRHLNISELAYGSEKTRSLFREMLKKASLDFDFHTENMPLMIEAIPLSEDSIMLLITKVEDPDEIDTRFSRFALSEQEDSSFPEDTFTAADEEVFSGADDILESLLAFCQDSDSIDLDEFDTPYDLEDSESAFNRDSLADFLEAETLDDAASFSCAAPKDHAHNPDFYQVFCFTSLDIICKAARILCDCYHEKNTLYKDTDTRIFYLVLYKGAHSPQVFNKVCNILSEYGDRLKINAGTAAYYQEHFDVIIKDHALQALQAL